MIINLISILIKARKVHFIGLDKLLTLLNEFYRTPSLGGTFKITAKKDGKKILKIKLIILNNDIVTLIVSIFGDDAARKRSAVYKMAKSAEGVTLAQETLFGFGIIDSKSRDIVILACDVILYVNLAYDSCLDFEMKTVLCPVGERLLRNSLS